MTTFVRSTPRRESGFSLIEVMVGLVIGLLAVILIMQVFATSEGSKRTTTGGGDAQINGTIALYGLERDIREAGYGINSFNLLGCSLRYRTTAGAGTVVTLSALAPVTINPANALVPTGDANTDTLLVVFGSPNGPAEGDLVGAGPGTGSYPVTTPAVFDIGDLVVAQPATRPSPCALAVDKVTAKTASTLTVTPGDATGLMLGSVVFNMGKALTVRAYAVRNGNLTVCDYTVNNCGDAALVADSAVWVPVAASIMSLRAQYGRDITGVAASQMTGVVGIYDQITPGSTGDTSGLAVQCGWARTLAIRLALVARNPQYDKGTPTTSAPTWAGTSTHPINLSNDGDWQHYRYKTLQTTVPIRNVVWQGSQTILQGGSAC